MRANNCAAMKIHLINRTKMLHFKIAKISIIIMPKTLSAKTLKLVPAINCNLKVHKAGVAQCDNYRAVQYNYIAR